jgi:hypothetical protein
MRQENDTMTWLAYSFALIVIITGILWGLAAYSESRVHEPATRTFQQ